MISAASSVLRATKIDQESFYLNTEDYRAFAVRTFAEQKQLIEDAFAAEPKSGEMVLAR